MSANLNHLLGCFTGLSNRQLQTARECRGCQECYRYLTDAVKEIHQNPTDEKIKSLQNNPAIEAIKSHHPFDLKLVFTYTDLQSQHLWEVWHCNKSCKCKQTWLKLKNALESYVYRFENPSNPSIASTSTIDELSKEILDARSLHDAKPAIF